MKGLLCGLVASTLFVTGGLEGEAWAQKSRRVVVEQFKGGNPEKFREMVTDALEKVPGISVVPDKKVAAVEADLGLLTVADSYPAVARELKAVAFVSGAVTGNKKKTTLKLWVKDSEGNSLGDDAWSGVNPAKAMASAKGGLTGKLKELLAGAKAPAGKPAAEAPVAKAEKPAEKPAEKKAEQKKEAPPPAETSVASEEAPKKKKKAGEESSDEDRGDQDEDASVAKKADEDDEEEDSAPKEGLTAAGAPVTGLDVAIGLHAYSRAFSYNQNAKGRQQEYKLPLAPALNLGVDYWLHKYAALTGSYEYSFGLISQDSGGYKYTTKAAGWMVGAKGRYSLGPADVMATVGYSGRGFEVNPASNDPDPPQVAGVNYKAIQAGGSTRVAITPTIALIVGGNYFVLQSSMGEINSAEYFPYAKAKGGEGFGGVAVTLPWLKGLEARAIADFRRYVFAMNSEDMDTRIAGGAIDQYTGLNISVAYLP